MLALEKTFIEALVHAVQEPSEETQHVASETLRDLLSMYQEDTLKKVAAIAEKSNLSRTSNDPLQQP
jgi:hypothetical protein